MVLSVLRESPAKIVTRYGCCKTLVMVHSALSLWQESLANMQNNASLLT